MVQIGPASTKYVNNFTLKREVTTGIDCNDL